MEQLKKFPFSSIAGALEYRAETQPEKRAILYPNPGTHCTDYASLNYRQYNNVTNHLAEKIVKHLPSSYSPTSNELVTCGLLAVGGLEYLLSQFAVLKLANVIMFPISARNSPAAVEHLLRETKTALLLTTSQFQPMIQTIQQQEEFQSLKVLLLDSAEFNTEKLLQNKDQTCEMISSGVPFKKKDDEDLDRIVVILHSSGSTAHPKPIYLTNRYFLISALLYQSFKKDYWQENDAILAWGALFHLIAFNGTTRAILIGCTYALPLCVTFPPKPDELLRNVQVTDGITVLLTVPSLLEQLIRELLSEKNSEIGLKPLQKLRFIMYGGAGCPDELCRMLVDNGVVLLSGYGATETGIILGKNYSPYDKRWKYMQLPDVRKPYVRIEAPPNSQNPNERMIVHLPSDPFLAENVSNTSDGCYTTGDILLEDPPNSGHYLILGRQDDTLVHITGEKTNPVPIEQAIQRSPLVQQVAVVGHNQFCTAALIQLNVEVASKYSKSEIEQKIWEIVEQVNKQVPSHSCLVRSLIEILPENQTLPVTHKGNIMRRKINQEFSTLINTMYDRFLNQQQQQRQSKETSTTVARKDRSEWTREEIRKYLEEKLNSLAQLPEAAKENSASRSIFDFGVNSLQVVEWRNWICQDICEVPKNFVYEHASIDQMTDELLNYLHSETNQKEQTDPHHYLLTESLIEKYVELMKAADLPATVDETRERVFLLTGANGSLGNFIIRDLLSQPSTAVKRVYCLLRGSDTKQRLVESFEQRQLDTSLLRSALDDRLVILSSSMDLSEEHLGQSGAIYEQLQREVTDIIHSAWKMNFNQTVKDFEHDCIRGVYHLLQLAASKRMQFHFISSIASAGSGLLSEVREEPLPRRAEVAFPQGYGQSKYISEHLCWAAMELWKVPVSIYRVGQVSGDTQHGVWNTTEMAPMMIYAGAGKLKKMPMTGEDVNWIPVDVCSRSLVDLALKSSSSLEVSPNERVYHLLNPHAIPYEDYLQSLRAAGLTFDTVTAQEFIDTILTATDTSNPLVKLSAFFEQTYSNKRKLKLSHYQTVKTVGRCEPLQRCSPVNAQLIELYLNYWKHCQVLSE